MKSEDGFSAIHADILMKISYLEQFEWE